MIKRDLFARQFFRQHGNILALPNSNAIFEQLDPVPAVEKEQRIIELIIRKDVFEVVLVWHVDKLLQRTKARDTTKFGPFQPLNGRGCHLRQAARRVIVAVDLGSSRLRGEPGHLVAKAHCHVTPTPMFILLQKGDNRLHIDRRRLKFAELGQVDDKDRNQGQPQDRKDNHPPLHQ